MKTLTYLAFICAIAFAILVLLIKWNVIPIFRTCAIENDTERVLIINAGHGGEDGGAVAADGTIEAELNLQIAKRLELLSVFFGVETVMTRTGPDIDYPENAKTTRARKASDQKARIELINGTPNGVLISIHQNKYSSAGPSGAQAFYTKSEESRELAQRVQTLFSAMPEGASNRVAMPVADSIFLMNHAKCTAVLAECGFISNGKELSLLKSEQHQKRLAAVLSAAYLSLYGDLEAD